MTQDQLDFLTDIVSTPLPPGMSRLRAEIRDFHDFGRPTLTTAHREPSVAVPVHINEFWTSGQRKAHSLHEVSYRACFKPQLPRFFIERLTTPAQTVYDPFMGRGTTVIEAALAGRVPFGCDINPLSRILTAPRLNPPSLPEIRSRLSSINLDAETTIEEELLVFYHPSTLTAITNLRSYLLERAANDSLDFIDSWIRMVATTRLTGHSPGFFSVYTLPPNQAVSAQSQRRINQRRSQVPPQRDVAKLILAKSASLLSRVTATDLQLLNAAASASLLLTASADHTPEIPAQSVHLVVTSPPFLDTVDYKTDNWLRCWFNGIDPGSINVWHLREPASWQSQMERVFTELARVLVHEGVIAFEVGEVRRGTLLLETLVIPAATRAGLVPEMLIINDQRFTKTSNVWGVHNSTRGTNSNRIVVIRKP